MDLILLKTGLRFNNFPILCSERDKVNEKNSNIYYKMITKYYLIKGIFRLFFNARHTGIQSFIL